MKYIYIFILYCFLLNGPLFSQGLGTLGFINTLGDKKTATYEDAIAFFVIVSNNTPTNFRNNKSIIEKKVRGMSRILLKAEDPVRRGAVALFIAEYLKLSDSLMYNIFKNQTYAVQACIADGIMDANCSSNDILSGEELIEIMNKVSEYRGGSQ